MTQKITIFLMFFIILANGSEKLYIETLKEIKRLDYAYYVDGISLVSDEEYDLLCEKLKLLQDKDKSLLRFGDLPKVAGDVNKSAKQGKHLSTVKGLDKVRNDEELVKWLSNKIGQDKFYVQPKIDGVNLTAYYENGKLARILTRGNGNIGNDVTIKFASLFPAVVDEKIISLHGELYVKQRDLAKLNKGREKAFASCRSAASSIVATLNEPLPKEALLSIYDCVPFDATFITMLTNILSTSEIIKNHSAIVEKYRGDDWPVDGIVLKTMTANSEKVAVKFGQQHYWSKVTNIIWNMSLHGVLTPVVEFESININGVVIRKASLYTAKYLERSNITIGAKVKVVHAGLTIPKIIEIIGEGNAHIPKECPYCDFLTNYKGEKLICINDNCKEKIFLRWLHFYGKNGLNVKLINRNNCTKIIAEVKSSSPLSLLLYTQEELAVLVNKLKLSKTIFDELSSLKEKPLSLWLKALAIPMCGNKTIEKLSNKYTSITEIIANELDSPVTKFFDDHQKNKIRLELIKNNFLFL